MCSLGGILHVERVEAHQLQGVGGLQQRIPHQAAGRRVPEGYVIFEFERILEFQGIRNAYGVARIDGEHSLEGVQEGQVGRIHIFPSEAVHLGLERVQYQTVFQVPEPAQTVLTQQFCRVGHRHENQIRSVCSPRRLLKPESIVAVGMETHGTQRVHPEGLDGREQHHRCRYDYSLQFQSHKDCKDSNNLFLPSEEGGEAEHIGVEVIAVPPV